MKRFLLVFALVLGASLSVDAQQDARYTQYMFNQMVFNPGYTGTNDGLSVTGIYRKQWVSIPGSPQEFAISAHTPLGNAKKIGIGGYFEFDQIGAHQTLSLFLDYAYKIPIGAHRLSIGVSGGIQYYSFDVTKLQGNEAIVLGDDVTFEDSFNRLMPNFGLGLYFYQPNKYYLGASVPYLLNSKLGTPSAVAHRDRHYHFMGGVVVPLGESLKLKPSVLVKMVPSKAPVQFDGSLMFVINDALWLGLSYRLDNQFNSESLDFIAAFQLKNGLRIGYAYDFTLSALNNYTSGSHEIMLGYDFQGKDYRIRTPRYF